VVGGIVRGGLARHVPAAAYAVPPGDTSEMFSGIPAWSRLCLAGNVLRTFLPFHDPDRVRQPAWSRNGSQMNGPGRT
jgi:hypothetical protein